MTALDTHRYIGLNITRVQEYMKYSSLRNGKKKLNVKTAPSGYGAVFTLKTVIYTFI
jgi:hypothetical protein